MNIAHPSRFDAVVIGGGFYGCAIALFLAGERKLRRVAIIERESAIMTRASFKNQARVHNGYHYPRNFTTAFRSRCSLPRFIRDWADAVHQDFSHVYAIARRESRVTARQFIHLCEEIGAPLEPASDSIRAHFERRLIEDVFVVQEPTFNARKLAELMLHQLSRHGVETLLDTRVTDIVQNGSDRLTTHVVHGGKEETFASRLVLNCTYSGLSRVSKLLRGLPTCRHAIAELALVQVPQPFRSLGVTVMDGPFFSLLPFPSMGLHTLSHVRYTPHQSFVDSPEDEPYECLARYAKDSRFERMKRDAARYLPELMRLERVDSLFEVKTVLAQNENDDGRPILFQRHDELPGLFSVMGGKIDNVYDVIEKIREHV
jgi:glycine/D-amino acid oxidase-like deaminating enzyme